MTPALPSDRSFGFVFTTVFLLVSLLPLRHGSPPWIPALIPALLFGLTSLIRPALLHPLNRLWFRFGMLLHAVMTPLVMSIVFFTTVTPIALILRLLGKRPLHLGFEPKRASYWIPREPPGPDPASMPHQF